MWKKGELVWVRLNPSDPWIPGRILDPSEPLGILVSFFDLMKPRYVPKPCLRSFDRDFETLVEDSLRFRRFVNRALQTHFWHISFGLWCSCQSPIDSPYLERGYSLPCSPPLSSDSALSFVREMAVSRGVPLRRLAETNGSTAQILSFRRYAVDFNRSESVYEEVIESAKLMDSAEEPDWYLDSSNNSSDLSLRDPLPKDIHCCSVDKVVQSWNTRSPLISSDSSVMKACGAMARVSNHEGVETGVQVEEEHKSAVEELEDRNDGVEDEKGHSETSDKEDETSKREEEVETESRNNNSRLVEEEDLSWCVREDGEAEKLQDTIDEEAGVETSDGECGDEEEEEEKAEESRSNKKVDLRKMTLGEWFEFMEVHVQKQIVEETEKMFELMRSKALRVDQYIAEQKQSMGKGSV
ncbi:hypothetical protein IGI04_021490 [Brassica rapa subsp. trilocularis]|uniref:Agenet domain-containing protein n=1 Tax=Brassica rapa subsp. trilocularis TaxID=1813537 RepID=A0ABQ7LZ00_BRACM|nr:hypothetical protein IGI04_021490 [Brassica rapa subsp. trilocularis]